MGYLSSLSGNTIWAFEHEGGITEITSDSMTMKTGDSFVQSDYVVCWVYLKAHHF